MKTLKTLALVLIITITTSLSAQIAPVDDNGLAIGGYDVVAYFSGAAQKGTATYKTTYNKATYHFASQDHLEAFQKSPKQYLPQYDGYCAWGVGEKTQNFLLTQKLLIS